MSARRRAPSARAPTDNSNNGLPEHRAHDGGTGKKRCALRGPLTLTPRTPAEPSRRAGPTPPRRQSPRLSPPNVVAGGSSQRRLSCGSIASGTSLGFSRRSQEASPRRMHLPPCRNSRRALARLPLGAGQGCTNVVSSRCHWPGDWTGAAEIHTRKNM